MVGIVLRTTLSFSLDTFAHLDLPPYLRLHPLGDHLILRQAFQDEDERVGRRFDTREIDAAKMTCTGWSAGLTGGLRCQAYDFDASHDLLRA
jgi:hypothetical protein